MIEKSKKAIKCALLELLAEKDFSQIAVNELLIRANISRGTFYAHFSNLEAVRQQLIDDLFSRADEVLRDYKPSELTKAPYPALLLVAQTLAESRYHAKQLFQFLNASDIGDSLKEWVTQYILSDEAAIAAHGGEEKAKVYAHFIAGGAIYAFNMWITNDFSDVADAEFIAQTLCDILTGGLNASVIE